jgi:hypothetical protein
LNQFKLSSEKVKEEAIVLEMAIDPALFREISNVIKGEKEVYGGVTVEIIDSSQA